jgi:hypothetical protein
MEKQKKDLKEFESELRPNSEFLGLFRDELINIAEKKSKKKKEKLLNEFSKKSRIDTSTAIGISYFESDSSDTSDTSTYFENKKINIVNTVNTAKTQNTINLTNVNKKNNIESKLDTETKIRMLNDEIEKSKIKENSEPTIIDEIDLSEYEIIKLKEIVKYFVNINK